MNVATIEAAPPVPPPTTANNTPPESAPDSAENTENTQANTRSSAAAATTADAPTSFAHALHATSTRSTAKDPAQSAADAGVGTTPPIIPVPLPLTPLPVVGSGANAHDSTDDGLTEQSLVTALAGLKEHSDSAQSQDGMMQADATDLSGLIAAQIANASAAQAGQSGVNNETTAMEGLSGDPSLAAAFGQNAQGGLQQLFAPTSKHSTSDDGSIGDLTQADANAAAPFADPTTTATSASAAQATASATAGSAADPSNPMEKAVAGQVNRALMQQLPGGDRMLVVRLTPPELGTVRIEVTEHQGQLTAQLHAEDDGVRQAIEHFLPSMRAELQAHDAPIRELNLADSSQFRSFSQSQQPRDQAFTPRQSSHGESLALAGANTQSAFSTSAVATLGGTIDASGVNLRA